MTPAPKPPHESPAAASSAALVREQPGAGSLGPATMQPPMQEIEPLLAAMRELGRSVFESRHRGWYLLKHPTSNAGDGPGRFDFNTVAVRKEEGRAVDPFAAEWRWIEIRKRAGNPFPDRVSVGRANNCDVVLRLPFISKLHAHFSPGDGAALILSDHRSANGTQVAGRPLESGATIEVHSGEWIAFGPLVLQLVDGSDLYAELADAFGL